MIQLMILMGLLALCGAIVVTTDNLWLMLAVLTLPALALGLWWWEG